MQVHLPNARRADARRCWLRGVRLLVRGDFCAAQMRIPENRNETATESTVHNQQGSAEAGGAGFFKGPAKLGMSQANFRLLLVGGASRMEHPRRS